MLPLFKFESERSHCFDFGKLPKGIPGFARIKTCGQLPSLRLLADQP